ncbi:predicted protein [Phaeodactylum tricornutum CCAP 1055/1]|jgi:hypothetical protein|uniref:Uncharacterized protein n=1 Tax=Phaeodactylum tricornutum (strain CCAP 1055/1) TaxID=556484 RepID=B7FXT6_PHATC|nr:predicted protein [Phaeodactylum tricornutum CCAP 1055/1]EEC48809.1 predicted protein [Phaeodactylum tricornutum CCAP 1055/1]|eukprot:XP_002179823.1 predicted protein [Phaeodactylum tricornutum CCAP 1055/1]
MARTSRGSVPKDSVDALDNLNLDDMFADGGDDLFGGLDIDLADMGDITAGGIDAKVEPMTVEALPTGVAGMTDEDETTPNRRKTKRKLKNPTLFEDDDDYLEEPALKKKRKVSKIATATVRKKGTKKAADESTPTLPKAIKTKKGKTATSITNGSMQTLGARGSLGSSSSGVAAAGRFGKRSSDTAPKTSKKANSSGKSNSGLLPSPSSSISNTAQSSSTLITAPTHSAQQQILQHPGLSQSSFCGLRPSNTIFYPFMPAMPTEPTLRNRKLYAVLDRTYSSFMSHLSALPSPSTAGNGAAKPPALEFEVIVKLMNEAFKDEKSATGAHHRGEQMSAAIGAMRRTISFFDKSKLAGDLMAICALLKRQFDFLHQNTVNMERWCKGNLSAEEYGAVYISTKTSRKANATKSTSVLSSFTTPLIRVKIVCSNGFKEPRRGPLVAVLPSKGVMGITKAESAMSPPKTTTKKSSTKKRVVAVARDVKSSTVTSSAQKEMSYVNMKASRRRKAVAELIARTARELEVKYTHRIESRTQIIDKQQQEARRVCEADPIVVIHTTGMWKWLDKSGYFLRTTDDDIQRSVDGLVSPDDMFVKQMELQTKADTVTNQPMRSDESVELSLFHRLQSLLVSGTGTEVDEDSLESDKEEEDATSHGESLPMADLARLSIDERLFIQLQSIGLAQSLSHRRLLSQRRSDTLSPSKEKSDRTSLGSENSGARQHMEVIHSENAIDELKDIITAMTDDLGRLNSLSSNRIAFLESIAVANGPSMEEIKRKNDEEANAIGKCHQLLKKAKESRVKNGKLKNSKKDEYALPW